MSVPVIQPSFAAGEISPSLFGRVDFAKEHVGAATMRNMFVSYRGGAYSRAGTLFCGYSKQTGRAYPPRLITFQYNINQGYALEFGNYYMRLLFQGAYVTESAVGVTNITKANPAVVTISSNSLVSAAPFNGSVSASYQTGDSITVAGGTFSTAAVLAVTSTQLVSIGVNSPGSTSLATNYLGYFPGDQITLLGGTASTRAVVNVATTKVVAAAVSSGGSGGTNGTQTVTGTTGTGTKFQASVTISGGTITAVNSITLSGSYTANPTVNAHTYYVGIWPYGHYQTDQYYIEPVTGAGLSGAFLLIQMGVRTVSVLTPGVFQQNPLGGTMTQALNSGAGVGATFQSAIMGPNSFSISNAGVYTVLPTNPASQASTSGSGVGAQFTFSWASGSGFNTGDWIYLSGVGGMTQVNGRTVVLTALGGNAYSLADVFGTAIDSTSYSAFTSGGTAARVYTLATPWGEQDLSYLKIIQSANVMSICCVNQQSLVEYPPYDLTRVSATNWTLTQVAPAPSVSPPTNASGSASSAGSVDYKYVVTAVSPTDQTESIASNIASINSAVNIAATAGTITITWTPVVGVSQYNIYKATPGISTPPPAGALFGYAGSAYGSQFIDANIVADFAQVPPEHSNPFARGQITAVPITTAGSSLTGTLTYTINTATGSGAVLTPVVISGVLSAIIITDPGQNYGATDTITWSASVGVAPTTGLSVGAQSGAYPGVCSYFQERRVYASSLNNPDTYWMSQPGSFTNFDARTPTIDSDAIEGSPWSLQVNGIQFMVPMPGGLVVLTGLSAWQIGGPGSSASSPQPITPSGQQATSQAYNGCSATLAPLRIENNIIYVQSKGSIYRLLRYNFFTSIYTGGDITILSSHLFTGYTMLSHCYCEEPYKVIWTVRNDGVLLSDTFLDSEQVNGWSRHDTQGLYQSVCSVTEPPIDALYSAVQRTLNGQTSYMVERADNRAWTTAENCWCVDAGLSLAQPAPAATLTASSATGLGSVTGVTGLVGGSNYGAATTAFVTDVGGGPGTGAVPVLTISGGVITNIAFSSNGSRYLNPQLSFLDPSGAGSGASASCVLNNTATFTTSASVFSVGSVGSVLRMGGGKAVVTAYTSAMQVTANILYPIVQPIPGTPLAFTSGNWTLTAPVSSVSGLWHLAGATVVGTVDGAEIPPTTVSASGTLTLPQSGSNVIVGLAFTPQLQSIYLDAGEPTEQGRRKKIAAATARVELSYGVQIGSNQPDGSTQSPPQIAPTWLGMTPPAQNYGAAPFGSTAPQLFTGDIRIPVQGGFRKRGQVALQQTNPYPLNVLALVPEFDQADMPETGARPARGGQQNG